MGSDRKVDSCCPDPCGPSSRPSRPHGPRLPGRGHPPPTDLTLLPTAVGSHVEVIEFNELRQRVEKVTVAETESSMSLAKQIFTLYSTVNADDFAWDARASVGLDRVVEDFDLASLAYYQRGVDEEQHERLSAGMNLGASLLTPRGIPARDEYELRTTVAQLATQVVGAGRSFTEIQALNCEDNVVEMGHVGPAQLAVSFHGLDPGEWIRAKRRVGSLRLVSSIASRSPQV